MPPKTLGGGLKVDFHIHSSFSKDGDMEPGEIIKAAKNMGLDAIAVTDHNTIRGGKEAEKLAKGLIVFVGSEIKTGSGEIIGLNLERDVPENLPLIQTCRLIKEQDGFLIVPHPFDRMRRGLGKEIEKIVRYIDAVEVLNARTLFDRFNRESLEFAEKHNLPQIAGSDSHFRGELGSAYTVVDSPKNKGGILEAVRERKTEIFGKKSGLRPHWKTFVTKLEKRF